MAHKAEVAQDSIVDEEAIGKSVALSQNKSQASKSSLPG